MADLMDPREATSAAVAMEEVMEVGDAVVMAIVAVVDLIKVVIQTWVEEEEDTVAVITTGHGVVEAWEEVPSSGTKKILFS